MIFIKDDFRYKFTISYKVEEILKLVNYTAFDCPKLSVLFQDVIDRTTLSDYKEIANKVFGNLLIELVNNNYCFNCMLRERYAKENARIFFTFTKYLFGEIIKIGVKYFSTIKKIETLSSFVTEGKTTDSIINVPNLGDSTKEAVIQKIEKKNIKSENILENENKYLNIVSTIYDNINKEIIYNNSSFSLIDDVDVLGELFDYVD